jgi:hypothetical protein
MPKLGNGKCCENEPIADLDIADKALFRVNVHFRVCEKYLKL